MSKVTTESLKTLGTRLHQSLRAVIGHGDRLPRPTDLSRNWGLDQTLCVRTCAALKHDDPLRVLHQLSSTGSLRSIVSAAQKLGVSAAYVEAAREAISDLENAIASVGGQKANLDTLIGSELLEAREKIEAKSKQSIFRGMSNLLGIQSKVVLTAYFVVPSADDPTLCNEIAIYGSHELLRLRPDLTTLLGGRILVGEPGAELSKAREILHGGAIDQSGFSVALKDFCSDPFPEVEFILSGSKLLYTLPGGESGESEASTMLFASIDRHALRRYRGDGEREAFFVFYPRNPSKEMLLDVLVHRDVWPGVEPRLDIGRGNSVLQPPGERSADLDQFHFCESLQQLGSQRLALKFRSLPFYIEMLEKVSGSLDLDLADFRITRLHVRYPVASLGFGIFFALPEAP